MSVNSALQKVILGAIEELERTTCLQFRFRCSGDRIEFTGEGDGCSSAVGRVGGRQVIRLPATSTGTCRTHRIVLHEIGHALGLWHEHTRPDRDTYVKILHKNIQKGQSHNFDAKRLTEINYRGEAYDYGSVMHYRLDEFSKNGSPTLKRRITAIANSLYRSQGQPDIGREGHLSSSDINQLNKMYSCSEHKIVINGRLRFYARYGTGLPDRDSGWLGGVSDPYIRVTAYNHNRYPTTRLTQVVQGNVNPEWNKWLNFGIITWIGFTVQVFDDDGESESDDTLSEVFLFRFSQSISYTNVRMNCTSGYIVFDVFFS